jgi:hypothetical protein
LPYPKTEPKYEYCWRNMEKMYILNEWNKWIETAIVWLVLLVCGRFWKLKKSVIFFLLRVLWYFKKRLHQKTTFPLYINIDAKYAISHLHLMQHVTYHLHFFTFYFMQYIKHAICHLFFLLCILSLSIFTQVLISNVILYKSCHSVYFDYELC